MCHFGERTDESAYRFAREEEADEDEEPDLAEFAEFEDAEDVRIVTDGGDE